MSGMQSFLVVEINAHFKSEKNSVILASDRKCWEHESLYVDARFKLKVSVNTGIGKENW